jgi:hypothetical protein
MKKRQRRLRVEGLMRVAIWTTRVRRRLVKVALANRVTPLSKKVMLSSLINGGTAQLSITRQNTRCLKTGRPRGVLNITGLSRHTLKD